MLYLYTLISLTVLDFGWLKLTAGFYRSHLSHLFAPSFSFAPAFVYYPLYALGVWLLILVPAVRNGASLSTVLLSGALFGLVAYGAYDLTNQATLKDWPLLITVVDMAWGAFVTAAACGIAFLIATHIK